MGGTRLESPRPGVLRITGRAGKNRLDRLSHHRRRPAPFIRGRHLIRDWHPKERKDGISRTSHGNHRLIEKRLRRCRGKWRKARREDLEERGRGLGGQPGS